MWLLFFAAACEPAGQTRQSAPGDTAPPAVPVDADHDGVAAEEDCDDTDGNVFPGAPEVCDGVDQDCDGAADEGVPNDGSGCADPGWPVLPDVVGTIQVTLATADVDNAQTDDPVGVCLGEWCAELDLQEWDDRERGKLDVHTFEDVGVSRADLDGFRVYVGSGTDRWQPAGFAVTFDGEGVYSRLPEALFLGTEGGDEVEEWTDDLGVHDDTIWPDVLTHGPMNGAVFAEGARVWFRTDRTRRVELRVAATADALATAPAVAVRYPGPHADFTEVVEVYGLGDHQEWAYSLVVDGVAHGPYTLVSGPADGAPGVRRVAFGSCTKDDAQPLFAAIRDAEPDVFLFVGDNHYANSDDLGGLRQWYRWAHERDERAELLREAAIYATWDDHDYVGNDTDGSAPGKEDALRAFGDYWANGALGLADAPGVYTAHTFGDLGIWLLDDRYWRGTDDSITGAAQEAWLLDSITTSTATFKLVVSGSQFNLDGTADSWREFPEAQARVVEALAAVGGVVFLSGDIHTSELVPVPGGAYAIPEFTSSPLAYNGVGKVIYLDVDTTVADPTLVARIVDLAGDELDRWELLRSELE